LVDEPGACTVREGVPLESEWPYAAPAASTDLHGIKVYFFSEHCRDRLLKEPERYESSLPTH
jgi:hypothetical protein